MGNAALITVILPYYNVATDGVLMGFGHAAEILVDSGGAATYYEYGLYAPGLFNSTTSPGNVGNLRQIPLSSSMQFDGNGNVTQASIKTALDQVFSTSGMYQANTGEAVGAVFNLTTQQLENANSFIDNQKNSINNGSEQYAVGLSNGVSNDCLQFVYNTAIAAGATISDSQSSSGPAIPALGAVNILSKAGSGYQYFSPASPFGNSIGSISSLSNLLSAEDAAVQDAISVKSVFSAVYSTLLSQIQSILTDLSNFIITPAQGETLQVDNGGTGVVSNSGGSLEMLTTSGVYYNTAKSAYLDTAGVNTIIAPTGASIVDISSSFSGETDKIVTSSNDTVTILKYGDTVEQTNANNTGDIYYVTGDIIGTGASSNVVGNGNEINMNPSSSSRNLKVVGNSNSYNGGVGDTVDSSGTGNSMDNISSGQITIEAGSKNATVNNANGDTINAGQGVTGNYAGANNILNLSSNSGSYAGVFGTNQTVNGDSGNDGVNVGGVNSSVTVNGGGYVGLISSGQSLTLGTAGSSVATANGITGISIANGTNYSASLGTGVTGNFYGSGSTVNLQGNSGTSVGIFGTNQTVNVDSGNDGVNIGGVNSSVTVNGGGYVGLISSGQSLTLGTAGSSVATASGLSGLIVNGSTSTISFASGTAGTVVGTANNVSLVSNSQSTLSASGTGDVISSQGNQITLTGAGSNVTIYGSHNKLAATGSNDTATVYETDLASIVSQEINKFTGGNGNFANTTRLFNLTDGTSEIDQYNPAASKVLQYTDYSGLNETGSITQQGYTNNDKTAQTTFVNPYGVNSINSLVINYNASGVATTGVAQYANGTKANIVYGYSGSGTFTGQQVGYYNSTGGSYGYENYNASDQATGGTYSGGGGVSSPPDSGNYVYYADEGFGFDFSNLSKANAIADYDLTVQNDPGSAVAVKNALAQALASAASNNLTPVATLEGANWNVNSSDNASATAISWGFDEGSSSSIDRETEASYIKTIESAFDTWSAVSGVKFIETSQTKSADIQINWKDFNTTSSGVLGDTSYKQIAGILQSGVKVNLEDPDETKLVVGTDGQTVYEGTQATLYQVTLHEIGHALGFADNSDPSSVLFAVSTSSNRDLDETDIAGVQALYGASTAMSVPAGKAAIMSSIDLPTSVGQTTNLHQMIQAMASFASDASAASALVASYDPSVGHQLAAATH